MKAVLIVIIAALLLATVFTLGVGCTKTSSTESAAISLDNELSNVDSLNTELNDFTLTDLESLDSELTEVENLTIS